jgi:hypothetical protein
MKITEIPFVSHIGIVPKDADVLMLPNYAYTQNHLQTIHAGAQYTLAETQSGYFLQNLFPKYRDKVIPLLRSCEIKYNRGFCLCAFSPGQIPLFHKNLYK